MADTLLSVGLDVGTTSTQLIVSELTILNQASAFTVPEMRISQRKILYESPVYLTPLLDESHIDGQGIRKIVEKEYAAAGICRQDVQTGAMIITGETSRKENAEAVLSALSEYAGDFVVATAGPDLESRLAAKGSGTAEYSEETGKTVLHIDIGGGTSNFALLQEGEILDTGCINVGGRLLCYDESGRILWVSEALSGIFTGKPGDTLTEAAAEDLADTLNEILEMAAGLRPPDERLTRSVTREGKLPDPELLRVRPVFSFSGGVADCMEKQIPWTAYGDIGPLLGRAVLRGRLCRGAYRLGSETIRATVIGAGCHSAQLSGSTVFWQNIRFPLKNIPALVVKDLNRMEETVHRGLEARDGLAVIALEGEKSPSYGWIAHLADRLAEILQGRQVLLCLQQDMAKALGQALALRLGSKAEILCMDSICLSEESYLDAGKPVGHAVPVVVKTLILEKG